MNDMAEGTPEARLDVLLTKLEERFPGVVNPYASDPPEPKLMNALDRTLRMFNRMHEALEWIANHPDDAMTTAKTLHYDMRGKAKQVLATMPPTDQNPWRFTSDWLKAVIALEDGPKDL